jgi:hypothetical protein
MPEPEFYQLGSISVDHEDVFEIRTNYNMCLIAVGQQPHDQPNLYFPLTFIMTGASEFTTAGFKTPAVEMSSSLFRDFWKEVNDYPTRDGVKRVGLALVNAAIPVLYIGETEDGRTV